MDVSSELFCTLQEEVECFFDMRGVVAFDDDGDAMKFSVMGGVGADFYGEGFGGIFHGVTHGAFG